MKWLAEQKLSHHTGQKESDMPLGQQMEGRATSSGLDSPVRTKVAIVTGASRGIGRGITERLLETGYCVVANSRMIPRIQDIWSLMLALVTAFKSMNRVCKYLRLLYEFRLKIDIELDRRCLNAECTWCRVQRQSV